MEALDKEIMRAAMRRNDIAHGKAIRLRLQSDPERDCGAFLVAPQYMTARTEAWMPQDALTDPWGILRSIYRYNAADIWELAGKFAQLHRKVWECLELVKRDPKTGLPAILQKMAVERPEDYNRLISQLPR
jgi:hypothetical protein